MEAREGLEGETMAKQLFNEFQDHFEWMDVSYHPDKIEGEIQGQVTCIPSLRLGSDRAQEPGAGYAYGHMATTASLHSTCLTAGVC